MLSLSRTRLLIGLAFLAAALFPAGSSHGQAPTNAKQVTFDTFDGVKLSGTLYTSPTPKRDAVVILLHAFDLKKGGSSQQEGWVKLAKRLQADGYNVLSFDFRGFGDSKNVSGQFWKQRHNLERIRDANKDALRTAETIDHTKFTTGYLPYLINDIAAAKAYLDRRNDAREVNSGNVILIGAGEGAALGALWLKNECRRHRDTNVPPLGLVPTLTPEAEVKDIACCVWLSIRPGFNNAVKGFVPRAITEAAERKHKVPMAFVYGEKDSSARNLSNSYFSLIKGKTSKLTKDYSGSHVVKGTSLSGNQLLGVDDTDKWIVEKYLDPVMTNRGAREQKDRKSEASAYWYVDYRNGKPYRLSKQAGVEVGEVDQQRVLFAQ